MSTQTRAAPAVATPREWVGLTVLALPTLLLSIDLSVLYLALPHIGADLALSPTQELWVTDIYGFMIAGFLITMGTLGDRIGRRRLLLVGAAAFGVASVVAAYAASAEMLIAARALLGIAGATLMPSTIALATTMFPQPRQRTLAVSVLMSCFMAGMAIGPLVGGLILELFSWGAVFLLGVPVMILLLLTAPALLPEYRDSNAGRIDMPSIGLSLAAVLPVVYGLKDAAAQGLGPAPVVAVGVGLCFGTAFVRRQHRIDSPLLDLDLLRSRTVAAALALVMFVTFTMGGVALLVNLYLQQVEGLSPLSAGGWLVPPALATLGAMMTAPALAARFGAARVLAAGLAFAAAGLAIVATTPAEGGLVQLIIGYSVTFAGVGPAGSLGTDLVVGGAPEEKAGSAASVSETTGELGIALGVALLGSIGLAVYRAQADLAGAAGESLAGARLAVPNLDPDAAQALLAAAREAYTNGMHAVAWLSAAGMVLLAAATLRWLRSSQS